MGTPSREQQFSFDAAGNWTTLLEKTSGTTDLDQSRTHDEVNQITEIAETTGPSWITPGYDAAGNMTTAPKPSAPDLTGGYTCKYDAWNRLVQVKQGSTVVSEAKYDGLGRRIQKGLDSGSPTVASGIDLYRHFYYSDDWQLLETRSGTSGATAPQALPVE